jgi:hypothetical protein
MNRRLGIIENPLNYETRNWKRVGIFFATFTLAGVVRFKDGLPQPWPLILVSILGAIVLTLSYLLWRPANPPAPNPEAGPESDSP